MASINRVKRKAFGESRRTRVLPLAAVALSIDRLRRDSKFADRVKF